MSVEELLSDDIFEEIESSSPTYTVVPKGHYVLKIGRNTARVRTAKSGDRYLSLMLAPVATATGESVNGKTIFHTVPFEGTFQTTDKSGATVERKKAAFFASFFGKGLGLTRDQVRSALASIIDVQPAVEGTDVTISIDGEPLALEGRTLMGSVRVEEYNGIESNKIGSVWAIAE
jgi:hypothetical protein